MGSTDTLSLIVPRSNALALLPRMVKWRLRHRSCQAQNHSFLYHSTVSIRKLIMIRRRMALSFVQEKDGEYFSVEAMRALLDPPHCALLMPVADGPENLISRLFNIFHYQITGLVCVSSRTCLCCFSCVDYHIRNLYLLASFETHCQNINFLPFFFFFIKSHIYTNPIVMSS